MPMYFISIVLSLPYAAGVWGILSLQWGQGGSTGSWGCGIATATMTQAWLPTRPLMCINPPLWSVSCEMFAYVALPLVLVVMTRGGVALHLPRVTAILVILEVCIWTFSSSALLLSGIADTPSRAASLPYGYPVVRVCEFALGVAVSANQRQRLAAIPDQVDTPTASPRSILSRVDALCGVDVLTAAILGTLCARSESTQSHESSSLFGELLFGHLFGIWYILLILLSTAWMCRLVPLEQRHRTFSRIEGGQSSQRLAAVASTMRSCLTTSILSQPILVWVGKVSYSIYTLQFPVLIYTAAIWNNMSISELYEALSGIPPDSPLLPHSIFPLLVASIVVLSSASYLLVERPGIEWSSKFCQPPLH